MSRMARRAGGAVAAAVAAASILWLGARGAPAEEPRPGDALVELGRRLFFDPAVSRSGDNSCVSCHLPDHGFSSPTRFDADDFSRTRRHSQTLIDAGLGHAFHWDGEFESIQELVTARLTPNTDVGKTRAGATGSAAGGGGGYGGGGVSGASGKAGTPREAAPGTPGNDPPAPPPPDADQGSDTTPPVAQSDSRTGGAGYAPAGHAPPGVRDPRVAAREDRVRVLAKLESPKDPESMLDRVTVADRIEADGRYAEAFALAFGSNQVSTTRVAEALTAYVDTLRSGTSPYDRHAAGDARALSASARRGLALFRGRAGCVQCHVMTGSRPAFTDREYHNTGIAVRARVRHVTTGPAAGAEDATTVLLPRDLGRGRLTSKPGEDAAFKTPTLRDVALRAPYMHDGSLDTLTRVVRHYARGAAPDSNLDPRLHPFDCTDQDAADLVAFLESLTSDVPSGIAPSPRVRAARTELRFTDAKGRPLAGLVVDLVPDGDRLPGDVAGASPVRTVETDAEGRVEFVPGRRTHTRVVLPDGLKAPQGGMVPDTCRHLTLPLPVLGKAALLAVLPAGAAVPSRLPADCDRCALSDEAVALLAEHAPAVLAAARERVATFSLVQSISLAGLTIARYEAWVPAIQGVPAARAPHARVTLAHPTGPRRVEVDLRAGEETRVDLTR